LPELLRRKPALAVAVEPHKAPGVGSDGSSALLYTTAGLDGLDAERERQMALSRSRRAKEVYDFTTIDELQRGERHDAVFVERGLE
jgi:hypothetical protein